MKNPFLSPAFPGSPCHQEGTPVMWSKLGLALATVFFAAALCACPSWGQPVEPASAAYRKVNTSDIIQGYVQPGESIETTGHVSFLSTGVFLLPNRISAQLPLVLDVSAISPENRTNWAACVATELRVGGCEASIRGRTGLINGRRGIFASEIIVLSESEIVQ
jgi:hypothetical protein